MGVCWEEGARETARDVTNINHNFSLKCINDVVRNQRSTVKTVRIVREGKVGLDRKGEPLGEAWLIEIVF